SVVALKTVEKLNVKIAGLVLAGGFVDPEFKDHKRPFEKSFSWRFDVDKIKRNTGFISALHDTHDVAISDDQAKRLGELLGVTVKKVRAVESHFDADEEPEILKAV